MKDAILVAQALTKWFAGPSDVPEQIDEDSARH
jgi:hypothetical protein